MAEDDPDDYYLIKDAIEMAGFRIDLRLVTDGEELMDYLTGSGRFEKEDNLPMPSLILLDLNMPRKSGWEALSEIRREPVFHHIPVVVLTTSKDQADVSRSYDLGADSFLTKPATFDSLVDAMRAVLQHWIETVKPPIPA